MLSLPITAVLGLGGIFYFGKLMYRYRLSKYHRKCYLCGEVIKEGDWADVEEDVDGMLPGGPRHHECEAQPDVVENFAFIEKKREEEERKKRREANALEEALEMLDDEARERAKKEMDEKKEKEKEAKEAPAAKGRVGGACVVSYRSYRSCVMCVRARLDSR
jgi:hypothetical protein